MSTASSRKVSGAVYKACVTDKSTGMSVFIELDCGSKTAFLRDVRHNGYSVDPKRVLTKKSYDYVIEHTNCEASDWIEYTDEEMGLGLNGREAMERRKRVSAATVSAAPERVYEIGYVGVPLAEQSKKGIGFGEIEEMHVAYGKEDLLYKLGWFVQHGIEVTEVDLRRSNGTYDDVSRSYSKFIGKK